MTVIDKVALALAPPPEAVMVYVAAADTAVGVPEIVPLSGSRLKPAGRAGVIMKLDSPADAVGVTGAVAVPTTKTSGADG